MSDPQNSGVQQPAWGTSNSNNPPMPFHRPPPPPAPYTNTQQGFRAGDRLQMSVRPPIRPPMENQQFAVQQLSAPASLHHGVHQYHNSGWGIPPTAPGPAAGTHAQWEPPRQAPNFSVPGVHQNTWGTVNDSSSSWSTAQQSFPPTYPAGNPMFNNLPLPPPPPPPMHQGNAPMNYLNSGAPAPHWSQREPTSVSVHRITHPPHLAAVGAGQYSNGINYQGAPSVTDQSNLGYSQTYIATPVQQQNLPQSLSFQQPQIHAIHNAPISAQTVQPSHSHGVPVPPPAPPQIPAGPGDVPAQKQPPPEGPKTSKNRRKRKRQQDQKKRAMQENAPPTAVAATATLIEATSDASSGVSPPGGQFSDPVDNELDQEMAILEFLIKRFDDMDRATPDANLYHDLEMCCRKIRELERSGDCPLPTLEVAEKRARLTRRAREIMASLPQESNATVASSEPSKGADETPHVNDIGRSDTTHVQPTPVAQHRENHSVATGYVVHNVEFAVEADSKAPVESSVPRKSASRALEEAKAKLRLAKLQMSLAAKKKALQEAKSKSGQSVDPINALLKGGLDCFAFEQIASSGPASKIRFLDALLDDDSIDDTEEKHSSDMSMDDDSSDEVRIRVDDPPLDPAQENLPVLRDEPSLLERITELQNLTLSKLNNFESGTKLQRLDKAGLTSLLRDTVDKTMEETNNVASLEGTSSLGSSKESKASTRALLKKRKEEALRSRALAHHKNVISKQQRMLRKQLAETEQIDQSIRVIDEEVLMLSNQKLPDLRGKIRTLEGRKHVLDDMLAGYLAELMGLRKELRTNKQQSPDSADWILSPT